jgi:hypothetical protein
MTTKSSHFAKAVRRFTGQRLPGVRLADWYLKRVAVVGGALTQWLTAAGMNTVLRAGSARNK